MTRTAPQSRKAAFEVGSKVYFTGNPCPHGHIAERRTGNGQCVECGRADALKRSLSLPKAVKSERDRAYRERNNEDICSRRRERYAERRDEIREMRREQDKRWNEGDGKKYKTEWRHKNRDRVRASSKVHKHKRRAAERAGGSFSASDIRRIFKSQKSKCAACGKRTKLTIDHIIPISKGGPNVPSNIQGLCFKCNRSKSARDPIDFMQSMGALL